jgi:hypothetical protein
LRDWFSRSCEGVQKDPGVILNGAKRSEESALEPRVFSYRGPQGRLTGQEVEGLFSFRRSCVGTRLQRSHGTVGTRRIARLSVVWQISVEGNFIQHAFFALSAFTSSGADLSAVLFGGAPSQLLIILVPTLLRRNAPRQRSHGDRGNEADSASLHRLAGNRAATPAFPSPSRPFS